jgi:hypothetical protein
MTTDSFFFIQQVIDNANLTPIQRDLVEYFSDPPFFETKLGWIGKPSFTHFRTLHPDAPTKQALSQQLQKAYRKLRVALESHGIRSVADFDCF